MILGGESMKLKRFFKDHRGDAGALALVITLIMLAVVLVVGIMVVGKLDTVTAAMDLGATGNTTRDTLFSNIYTALDLSVIVPIVAGAGLIIGVVVAYLSFKRT